MIAADDLLRDLDRTGEMSEERCAYWLKRTEVAALVALVERLDVLTGICLTGLPIWELRP
jgi:hypothetical protein